MTSSRLSAVLCLALIGASVATPSSASTAALAAMELPQGVYVEIGGEIFHVDFTSVIANRAAVASGSGSFTISVKKAVLADSDGGPAFVLSDVPSSAEVRLLGADLAAGRFRDIRAWSEIIAWSVFRTPWMTTTALEVGRDRLSMSIPQSVIDGRPAEGETVDVQVNRFVASLDPDRHYRSVTRLLRGLPPGDRDDLLLPLAGQFVDGARFVNAYIGFELIAHRMLSTDSSETGCLAPCVTCVTSGIASAASLVAIASACAATIGSAGIMAPACAAALLAHLGANLSAVSFCAMCVDCLNTDPPGGGGGGGSSDPSGECPAGYHECCNNQCCSDANPPADCGTV